MEREVLEFDVQFVGAGPAGLAGAIHLANLIAQHNERAAAGNGTALPEMNIAVLEKSAEVGAHGISGAVMDPRAIRELFPDYVAKGCPIESDVTQDDIYILFEKSAFRLPITPPALNNHGNAIVSLGELSKWLAAQAEERGILIATETPAQTPLLDGSKVLGVRTGDKGIDKHGNKKGTYQPGADCMAKVTVLCEGPRGTIGKQLEKSLGLTNGKQPQNYATGVKELLEVPAGKAQKGRVIHTMNVPLPNDTFGGGFIYGLSDSLWYVGMVTGLDAKDPTSDPHGNLQKLKTHPLVSALLEGGKPIA
ncbi:MAG: NAD(P)/FAD-dependent oxidoreductase, partial [Candidatus Eisenbacteria bacterium]|nr:NAD(P)/FAD-dependent oxidoreductase [Candidatus Eisenbacteria bacterium]